jgi:hypothetical protein
MADRFFPNDLPPFMEETTLEEATSSQTPTPHSLTSLLSLPCTTLTSKLQAAAFHFKQSVIQKKKYILIFSLFGVFRFVGFFQFLIFDFG